MATDQLPQEATRRLQPKKQTLDDAYAAPANFLEIDVVNPITHGVGRNRFTDYEVRMRVSCFAVEPLHFYVIFRNLKWLVNISNML
jgi:sorting nexin-3/12